MVLQVEFKRMVHKAGGMVLRTEGTVLQTGGVALEMLSKTGGVVFKAGVASLMFSGL